MKKLYTLIIISLAAAQTFAAVDLKKEDSKLASVLKLEQSQDYFGAVLTSAQESAAILNQLHVDEIVTSTATKLTEIRNEVITNKYSQSGQGSILFGLISGQAQKSWDSSEIITANPAEVDGFSAKISADFRTMRSALVSYVQQNELALAYAKAFALKTVQLASNLSPEDRKNLLPMIKSTVQFSQQLRFLGAQSILSCIETNYANRTNSRSLGLNALFLSFAISQDHSQVAHSKTNCSSSANQTEVTEAVLVSAKLSRLDALIASYQKQLGLLEVTETKAEPFETWGSPYYQK